MAEEKRRGVNPLVKLFVAFHAFMVLSWSLPRPAPAVMNGALPPTAANLATHAPDFLLAANLRLRSEAPTRYYMLSSGLWQYWDMFSPNPANVDFWYDSVVTYRDGTTRVVPYPRIHDLPIWEKYFKERFRKFIERVNNDGTDAWKRPQFAQRMALLAYTDAKNPPVRVELRRHFKTMKSMYEPVPEDYTTYSFFTWIVDQDRLRREAKRALPIKS
ncbi:MAG: hypothetical protein KIT11_06510 [Fimbriimonadaceae bacterium]|nr:hypothetical protein [Fimbriimonadaceae bacterium]QYK56008.1 MAG: hypothetical protein KF733_00700 [Fimbriimonadaceae bacterium]